MKNSSDYSLLRLKQRHTNDIIEHISGLPPDDLYLRFGYSASRENICAYVTKTIETDSDYWWGIFDDNLLIATIHVSIRDSVAEFAFTVHQDYRGQKLGQLLFARGYQLVAEHQVDRIYFCMLSKNKAMIAIAKKFGMSVMTYGTDSDASVSIQYPVPLHRINEIKMCFIDKDIFKLP